MEVLNSIREREDLLREVYALNPHLMSVKDATAIAGPLGYPSKMPGTAYGISAEACITGGVLAKVEGSVCFGCYAMKGNYLYDSVRTAHEKRIAGLSDPRWVAAMVTLLTVAHYKGIGRNGAFAKGYHRWMDSGDLQSVEHLAKICDVASATPNIQHWLPTREQMFVKKYVADGGIIPENLLIRASATMVDGPAPKSWPYTSRVHTKVTHASPLNDEAPPADYVHVCPAPLQNGHCGPCRACWSKDVPQVTYHKH